MRVGVRKVQIEDVAKLQALVAENIDAIEPGLVVLDSRLLLGHTTVDVVGLDASGALVLIATGLTANEEMLLKAVEAYSWCREYPQSLERLYPGCVISDERPPRLLFVVERMPDAFQRKIKQLGFPELDCVEFRLLDVDGVSAVYFESILKLRRPGAPMAEAPAAGPENVIAMNDAAARPGAPALQKLLTRAVAEAPRAAERVAAARDAAPVVSMVGRQAAAAAPRLEPMPLQQPEPVVLTPEPVTVAPAPVVLVPEPVVLPRPEPVIIAPTPTIVHTAAAADEPSVESDTAPDEAQAAALRSNEEIVAQLQRALAALGTPVPGSQPAVAGTPSLVIPSLNGGPSAPESPVNGNGISLRDLPELSLRPAAPVEVPRPAPLASTTAAQQPVSFKGLAGALLGETVAPAAVAPTPVEPAVEPAIALDLEVAIEPAPVAAADEPLELETRVAEPVAAPESALTVEALLKNTAAPAVDAPKPAPALPQEFEGLKFPNDGVLTRQWMEFLSQMSTTK